MINSAEEFIALRTSINPDEYYRAAHEYAPEHVWLEVIEKYPEMREWVAHNKTTSRHILELLSNDQSPRVRSMVACRGIAGENILNKLASDPNESVRLRVAYNPKVSRSILLKLQYDNWETIREVVTKKLGEMDSV